MATYHLDSAISVGTDDGDPPEDVFILEFILSGGEFVSVGLPRAIIPQMLTALREEARTDEGDRSDPGNNAGD